MLSDNMMLGGGGRKAAYSMENSLLFRGGQSLYRPFTTSVTIGLSMWVRRAKLGVISPLLGTSLKFNANDTLTAWNLTTTAAYRDPTAWTHIAIAAGHLYVNGEDKGAVTTSAFTCSATNCLGYDGTNYFHGEFAEFVLADGGQPAIGHYGEFDPVTLNWRPKLVSLPANLPVYGLIDPAAGTTIGGMSAGVWDATRTAAKAFDGGLAGSYSGGAVAATGSAVSWAWIGKTYSSATAVTRVIIHGSTDQGVYYGHFSSGFTSYIEWSDNGTDWTIASSQAFTNTAVIVLVHEFSAGTHLHWRTRITSPFSDQNVIFAEVQLFTTNSVSAYGTNGCYLGKPWDYSAGLGKDYSGRTDALNLIAGNAEAPFGGNINTGAGSSAGAGFDGSLVWGYTNCVIGSVNANPLYVGQYWGTTGRVVSGYVVKSPASVNFSGNNATTVTLALYGSDNAPATATDGILLHQHNTVTNTPSTSLVIPALSGISITTEYKRHWVVLTSIQGEKTIGEVEFYSIGGNNWMPFGFASTDVLTDTPTNVFATLNLLYVHASNVSRTLSNGNRTIAIGAASVHNVVPYGIQSGRYCWELRLDTLNNAIYTGVCNDQIASSGSSQTIANTWNYAYVNNVASKNANGSSSAYGSALATGKVVGHVLDMDAGTLEFFVDGASQEGAFTGLTGTMFPYLGQHGTGVTATFNGGQSEFSYPNAYGTAKPLCTANMPATTGQTSGSFTGNANADGPCIYTGAVPETLTINNNVVTWGTHADKLATGFKIRSASASYNASSSNSWTATYNKKPTVGRNHVPANAQATP